MSFNFIIFDLFRVQNANDICRLVSLVPSQAMADSKLSAIPSNVWACAWLNLAKKRTSNGKHLHRLRRVSLDTVQARGPGFRSLKPALRKKIKAKEALWQAPVIPTSDRRRPGNSRSLLASRSVSSRFLRNPAIKCTVEGN